MLKRLSSLKWHYVDYMFYLDSPRNKMGSFALELGDKEVASIWNVWIDIREHNKGYGQQLMKEAIQTVKELGRKKLWLTVDKDNAPARHIYEKLGFGYVPYDSRELLKMELTL
jgi:ribosomal protein S18 acetylase RimI-like enzyme